MISSLFFSSFFFVRWSSAIWGSVWNLGDLCLPRQPTGGWDYLLAPPCVSFFGMTICLRRLLVYVDDFSSSNLWASIRRLRWRSRGGTKLSYGTSKMVMIFPGTCVLFFLFLYEISCKGLFNLIYGLRLSEEKWTVSFKGHEKYSLLFIM